MATQFLVSSASSHLNVGRPLARFHPNRRGNRSADYAALHHTTKFTLPIINYSTPSVARSFPQSLKMATQFSAASASTHPDDGAIVDRHIARFPPNHWGNLFANYIPDDETTKTKKQQQIKKLAEEVRKELLGVAGKPLEQLKFINAVQRLGVSYHFEKEIEDALQDIFDTCGDFELHDLYHTTLGFRLLRQHGFYVSSGIFLKFKDAEGNLKESLKNDVEGMLSLYESTHLRTHGDDILEEAVIFAANHLKSIITQLNYPLLDEVTDALKFPLQRSLPRLKTRHYIPIYEHDPSHNETLLKLAKLDFNNLQCCYKEELKDMIWWWNDLALPRTLGYIKNRIVEASFWGFGVYYEPRYALGRKFCAKMCQLLTTMDDTYDAYATLEELELFTEAIHRWDKKYAEELKLPDNMKTLYTALVDVHEEYEQYLAAEGRSHCITYVIEELKILSRHYLQETKWCYDKYTPTYDEYFKNAIQSIAYTYSIALAFLGMGHAATTETFEWVRRNPPPVVASCAILRLLDDIGGRKFNSGRDHVASAVECYMKQSGVSEKEAIDAILKQVETHWKDLNQVFLKPSEVPLPLANCILNGTRVAEVIYRGGDDTYTCVDSSMKDNIQVLFVDPIPVCYEATSK